MTETLEKKIEPLQDLEPSEPPHSQWKDVWDQFKKHKGALMGGSFLLLITLGVLFGEYIWTIDPQKLDIRNKDIRPIYTTLWDGDAKVQWAHPFGTDNLEVGRVLRDTEGNSLSGCRCHIHAQGILLVRRDAVDEQGVEVNSRAAVTQSTFSDILEVRLRHLRCAQHLLSLASVHDRADRAGPHYLVLR